MHQVFPELVMDLLCYGPIEKGSDASYKSLDYYCYGVDAAGLATAADSFAALHQKVEIEKRLTWEEVAQLLQNDWAGPDGELYRRMMKNSPRYGSGNSSADEFAVKIAMEFSQKVVEKPTPAGYSMIPGIFGWASVFSMGEVVGATPNGRFAGKPISHGANPDPGFRKDGAPTALSKAVADVQPGYGNTAPAQLDIDPMLAREENAVDLIMGLLESHFHAGGTQINLNILDTAKVLEAYKDPSKHPDLVVRVTGFSAFFASLSPDFRKLVVDRILAG